MSRIASAFERLRASGRKALIPYITSGHPSREATLPIMHAMVAAGADAIELGVPFSDPMADGPVIQRSSERALALGVGLKDVLDYVSAFRKTNTTTPVVLMGYANPIERMGTEKFLQRASEAGVDGLIVVDYPPEEGEVFARASLALGIDPIFLFAPTSTDTRIDRALQVAAGYVYYVSLKGITGGTLDQSDVIKRVANLRTRTNLPIAVGFGIRDGTTAHAISRFADGVIIGTRMIQVLEEGDAATAPARAGAFISEIRKAMDA